MIHVRVILLAVAAAMLSACGSPIHQRQPAPIPTTASHITAAVTGAEPCATQKNTKGVGMVHVSEAWPETQSTAESFTTTTFDDTGCSTAVDTSLLTPDCKSVFPWFPGDLDDEAAALAHAGATYESVSMIQGNATPHRGQNTGPLQEVDEVAVILNVSAEYSFLTDWARACGIKARVGSTATYQEDIYSADVKHDVRAYYIPDGDVAIWLEFNLTDWTNAEYAAVLSQAIHDAKHLG